MHHEVSAVVVCDDEWCIGYGPEVPGANGQGRTLEACRESLFQATLSLLEVRREEGMRGIAIDAIAETVTAETTAVEMAQTA